MICNYVISGIAGLTLLFINRHRMVKRHLYILGGIDAFALLTVILSPDVAAQWWRDSNHTYN